MRAAIALFLLFASSAFAQGFDIKGITIGTSYEALMAKFPLLICKDPRQNEEKPAWCTFITKPMRVPEFDTLAGAAVTGGAFSFDAASNIGQIYFQLESNDFAVVADAMIAKFGAPTKTEDSEITNRMGAAFQQKRLHWIKLGETLTIQKYADNIKTMFVTLTSLKFLAYRESIESQKARVNAKDL